MQFFYIHFVLVFAIHMKFYVLSLMFISVSSEPSKTPVTDSYSRWKRQHKLSYYKLHQFISLNYAVKMSMHHRNICLYNFELLISFHILMYFGIFTLQNITKHGFMIPFIICYSQTLLTRIRWDCLKTERYLSI